MGTGGGVLYGVDSGLFFRELCRGAGQVLPCHRRGGADRSARGSNPNARGPNGEGLYLDTARFGPADAPQHAGADLEHARCRGPLRLGRADRPGWRPAGPTRLPKDTGALIVHGDQPLRLRLDAAGSTRTMSTSIATSSTIDKAYPKNDGYLAIADAILPQDWTEESQRRDRARCSRPTPRSTARSALQGRDQQWAVHPSRRHLLRRRQGRPGATARSARSPREALGRAPPASA